MARETFTDQQWQQLVDAAPSIARAVAATSGSPAQTELELEAFLRLLEQTRNETSGHGLLGSLVADVHARLSSGTLSLAAEDVVADGIHAARQVGALLAVHHDEQEARAVRYWLMEVARTVAGAARDGGLLGLGGRTLSRAERDTLAAISEGLGMNESVNLRDEPDEAAPAADTAPPADTAPADTAPADNAQPEGELGPDGQPIGPDNIRDGTVRGVMGGPHQQGGEGQGG